MISWNNTGGCRNTEQKQEQQIPKHGTRRTRPTDTETQNKTNKTNGYQIMEQNEQNQQIPNHGTERTDIK